MSPRGTDLLIGEHARALQPSDSWGANRALKRPGRPFTNQEVSSSQRCRLGWVAVVATMWCGVAAGQEQEASAAPTRAPALPAPTLQVHPARIQLDDGRDRQRVTALLLTASGAAYDRTRAVSFRVEPDLAEITRDGDVVQLRGLRNGNGTLTVRLDDTEVRVPLLVQNVGEEPPVDFRNDVIPALTRAGCNAGSCHGAASGKEGFALSLFGYDPNKDHLMLTRDLRGRRLDPASPEHSLVLQKATGAVPHKGNKRFAVDSPAYRLLREWIGAGAPDDATTPALVAIEVLPDHAVLIGAGEALPLQVRARYQNGADRDVTATALWSSNNDSIAAVANDGRVTSDAVGEAVVLARFGGLSVAAQVLVLADDRPFLWPDPEAAGFVDQHVHQKLRRARVTPAEPCNDRVFVRRVFLDLINMLPTPVETETFVADKAPDKRTRLIDDLLQRPEFALLQAMSWAEVMQVDAATMEAKGAALLTRWLQQGFTERRPFDALVRDLLLAEGSTFQVAEAAFWLAAREPHLLGERVAQNFLGVRLQCAQCHNHPFENFSMDDYYGFAAFFAQVGQKRAEDPNEWIVFDRRNGAVRNRRDNTLAEPRFLGGGAATIPRDTDRRQVFADWLCAPDNPYFASNVVNRIWARLFGRGLVDPPDDVRISNPASHPALLQQLAALLVASRYEVRAVYRAFCSSRTYQAGRHPGNPAPALFAGNHVRRLSAEQLLDAIGAVTGVPSKYPGVPLGQPATALALGRTGVRFLDTFGRPARETACTCERRVEPTLGQTLHLINGDTIVQKIADKNGRLSRRLADGTTPEAMLDELFLAAYCRVPHAAERTHILQVIAGADDRASAWQDVFWAVLNSQEFSFQH